MHLMDNSFTPKNQMHFKFFAYQCSIMKDFIFQIPLYLSMLQFNFVSHYEFIIINSSINLVIPIIFV